MGSGSAMYAGFAFFCLCGGLFGCLDFCLFTTRDAPRDLPSTPEGAQLNSTLLFVLRFFLGSHCSGEKAELSHVEGLNHQARIFG